MVLRHIPVIDHFPFTPTSRQRHRIEKMVCMVHQSVPGLGRDKAFNEFLPSRIINAPALLLDDFSDIMYPGDPSQLVPFQDRARLRSGDGDLVACCAEEVPGYEWYLRHTLGLGDVKWLRPNPTHHPAQLASACWQDRSVRRELIHRLRTSNLRYLHPHMGSLGVWQLAELLHQASRMPVEVIAPPPALTNWVNNKVEFARIVENLIGAEYVPRTSSAWNLATLTTEVERSLRTTMQLCLKLPSSVGGMGNIVFDTEPLLNLSHSALMEYLRTITARLRWDGNSPLLVDDWEENLVDSPSVQMWIPPIEEGPPIVEGIFSQLLDGLEGVFVGVGQSTLPYDVQMRIAEDSWMLGSLFQQLGYLGRCSFDLVAIGPSMTNCRHKFIECNGRWGGTSTPMTLMNRLFGIWSYQPFVVKTIQIAGLHEVAFGDFTRFLKPHLYSRETKSGWLILFNAAQIRARSKISLIAIGETMQEATARLEKATGLLQKLVDTSVDSKQDGERPVALLDDLLNSATSSEANGVE